MIERCSVLDMFGPIYGENWHAPEIVDGLTFRWSDATAEATLKLPAFRKKTLRFSYFLAYMPQAHQIDEMRLYIDGAPREFCWAFKGVYSVIWTDVIMPTPASSTWCAISTPPIVRSPQDRDTRPLGLAISSVEILVLTDFSES